MFCPTCKSLLIPKEIHGKRVLACSGCGKVPPASTSSMTFTETSKQQTKKVEVISEEKDTRPLVNAECTKCGHSMAYHWEVQTRAADETATRFFKCEKCKHTWREYK